MDMKNDKHKPVEIVKEMLWLAWKACGSPFGMGILQDKPTATKEDIWNNANTMGDYPIRHSPNIVDNASGFVRADYVFGRMMKLNISISPNTVKLPDARPKPDYQAWCSTYWSYQDLYAAAVKNLEEEANATKKD